MGAFWRLVEGLDYSSELLIGETPVPGISLIEGDAGTQSVVVGDELPPHIWERFKDQVSLVVFKHHRGWLHIDARDYEEPPEFFRGPLSAEDIPGAIVAAELLDYRAYLHAREAQEAQRKLDASREGFVNVHTHSEYSALDGLSRVDEMVALALKYNQPGLAVTDHGINAGHPELLKRATDAGIVPILGQEAYFVPDRRVRENQYDYFHLILWAENDQGLRNLWAASTEANRSGFYGRPRMDYQIFELLSTGLLASTACLRGPISQLLLDGRQDAAEASLARLLSVFPDRLWVEIHANHLPETIRLNKLLVDFARRHGLPLIAAVDSHYPCSEDMELHQIWLKAQTTGGKGQGASDDSGLFAGAQPYHIMTRQEVRQALSYLPIDAVEESIDQTVALVHRIQPYNLTKAEPPIFSIEKGRKFALETLLDLCMRNWDRKITSRPRSKSLEVYMERFEYEMGILVEKQFVDYYCIVSDYVRWAKRNGILVGPGRGSGSASLVAFLADITEVDPVENDLPFARFITIDRVDPPDFDVDFPASKREAIQHYIAERWGLDWVARVGTHTRLRNKGAIRDVARVLSTEMQIDYSDVDAICKIIEEEEADSAGLGKPWDVVMTSTEEIMAPYVDKYPKLFETAAAVVGRLKTYGKHAAGMVISTGDPLTGRLPMRQGDADQMVAEFDFPALELMGLLKFDLLTLRTLDTLQVAMDLIKERRGIQINFYDWVEEYHDPQVWEAISNGETLGVFQFETRSMTRMVRRYRPTSILNLADINSLVRPGPARSGMTELYFRRREGIEAVTYPHPLLEEVLKPTYGMVVYQEQVMRITQIMAGFDDVEANKVRSIMGKKKVDQVAAKGEEFVKGCLERDIPEETARKLWAMMAEFGKYGFSICHAYPYSMLGYYCAWLRVHYPEEFFTAVLSTVDKDRVPEFVGECQRLGYGVVPPDINLSKEEFTPGEMSVRYGLLGVKGIGKEAAKAIIARQPFLTYEDFRERVKGTACNIGTIKTLAAVGALDSIYPNRRELETLLVQESEGIQEICKFKDESFTNDHGLPCHFDWSSEPVELTKTGRPKKRKEPPKRCTKGCRNYDPQGYQGGNIEPYAPMDIMDREMEMLGVWLSYNPFDRVPEDMWAGSGGDNSEKFYTGSQIELAAPGDYNTIGLLREIKYKVDSADNPYAFIEILAKDETLSVVIFSSVWSGMKRQLRLNQLGFYMLTKTDRGLQLKQFYPVAE